MGGLAMHALTMFRAALVTAVIGAALVAVPQVAVAVPATSAVEVSPTSMRPGDTFTVSQTLYNSTSQDTILGGKAGLYFREAALTGLVDLVSCPGAFACDALGTSYRGGVGEVAPGESRTVVFTFRVKDDASAGQYTLQHQFVGENYAFEILDGPVITILPKDADLAVTLSAAVARTTLAKRIVYTVGVKNNGPADATGIRLTATYPAGLVFVGSSGCTRVARTRTVTCDLETLGNGATASRSFTVDTTLLTRGFLEATAQRTQSSPTDPNAANDRATRTCTAITGLLVRC
jgi:uncharacterized repeat protein (TIGR01451 family)